MKRDKSPGVSPSDLAASKAVRHYAIMLPAMIGLGKILDNMHGYQFLPRQIQPIDKTPKF